MRVIAAWFFVVGLTVSAAAQVQTSTYAVPRTPWGDPDLQGVWPSTRALARRRQRQASLIVEPADGRMPPMTPEAKVRLSAQPTGTARALQQRHRHLAGARVRGDPLRDDPRPADHSPR